MRLFVTPGMTSLTRTLKRRLKNQELSVSTRSLEAREKNEAVMLVSFTEEIIKFLLLKGTNVAAQRQMNN